jgi:predicted nucleic acid-binding protein
MPTVVLDTNVVIALMSRTDTLHAQAADAVETWEQAGARFVLSAVSWAELTVGAARRGDEGRAALGAFLNAAIDRIVPVDQQVSTFAGLLRAEDISLRLPDALVIATGIRSSADAVLTGDKRIARHAPSLVEVVG